ncbi:MAG: STAS domain-containing protein [Spirochaetes bacterium]|nr:STAS domain-containing protein [Spirochaetota bacterium]
MKTEFKKDPRSNDVAVVRLDGRLDAQNADAIEEELISIIDKEYIYLIIDMKKINYLGSCGIRIFLGIINKLNELKGKIKFLNMSDTGKKILEAMEILNRFDLYKDEEEALRSF